MKIIYCFKLTAYFELVLKIINVSNCIEIINRVISEYRNTMEQVLAYMQMMTEGIRIQQNDDTRKVIFPSELRSAVSRGKIRKINYE